MKKFLVITFLPLAFIGCVNSSPTAVQINKIPPKLKTAVVDETSDTQSMPSDDHRYNEHYQNFNYDRLGYSTSNGIYYGYYDQQGYFYNNCYFTYDNDYTYEDRYNRQGYFDPNNNHRRPCLYHNHNNWNRDHHYVAEHQYMDNRPYTEYRQRPNPRVYHPQDGQIRYGDLSYQNSQENIENRRNNR